MKALLKISLISFWTITSVSSQASEPNSIQGLILDLNADKGVELEDGDRVKAWKNQVLNADADIFVKRDEGRKNKGSGRPTLEKNLPELNGHNTLIFAQQELVNMNEDAFDHLTTGSGYTWFAVLAAHEQKPGKKDVNSFFGNLKNGNPYEGFWGNLMDDNRVWMGTRNGITPTKKAQPALWDEELNPQVISKEPLEIGKYYLIIGRMGAGTQTVTLDLYVNSTKPIDSKIVPVNSKANPSKMAIGQERDATNHPGLESFCGEIARLLIFERPLSDEELAEIATSLKSDYAL